MSVSRIRSFINRRQRMVREAALVATGFTWAGALIHLGTDAELLRSGAYGLVPVFDLIWGWVSLVAVLVGAQLALKRGGVV